MSNVSFEKEIRDFLRNQDISYKDYTNSATKVDFSYTLKSHTFWFDVKEKRQEYNMKNWTDLIPEKDCFILDELGIRKVMEHGAYSGIIIRNNLLDEYIFFSFLDLFSMPKIRVNRETNSKGYLKGKWIINLNNGKRCKTLKELFLSIGKYKEKKDNLFSQGECYGEYSGEKIEIKGTTRTGYYKFIDYSSTR